MTEQLLLHYTRLVEFLGHVLGPDYEIILHEILPEQSPVASIANGGISGRDVGAPITNAALRMIMQKQYETSDYNLNYTGQLANGKTIRSSTMFIKDGGKLVGLLCINFDDSRFHEISDAILKLIHPDDFVHHHYFPVDAPAKQPMQPQHAEAVRIGIQLTFAACGAVTIVNDHIFHLHVAVQGVDGHFGLDFKAAAQHRVGFDKLVAERTVARHDILDLAAEEVVGKKPHQVVAKIVERAFVLGVIGGGKPIPHHHISLMFGDGFDHFRGRFRRVGIVAVHHDIGFGVNFAEHAADDVAFALLVFVAHHGTGCAGQLCRAIGRVVIVHKDRSFRQNTAEIHHNLLYCLRFVITGDKNCYFIQ